MGEHEDKIPHDVYDRGYKLLLSFTKIFQQLIEGYVKGDWRNRLDYAKSQRIDKSFILKGLEKQETDVLYKVPLLGEQGKDVFLYVLIEQQSTVDYSLAFRILIYMGEIWTDFYKNTEEKLRRQKRFRWPAIFPIVLYNGAGTWTAAASLIELIEHGEVFKDFIPNFKYHLVDVSHYEESTLKQMGNSLAGVFLLEQERDSKEQLEMALKEALEIVNNEPDEELWKAIIEWIVVKLKREFPEKMGEVLDDLDFAKHSRKEIKSMLETMPKKLFTLGKQEGIRDSIIEVLEEKFGQVPLEIAEKLGTIAQASDFAFLLRKSATVQSLKEFKNILAEMIQKH
jgi:predicted transposase YdaD